MVAVMMYDGCCSYSIGVGVVLLSFDRFRTLRYAYTVNAAVPVIAATNLSIELALIAKQKPSATRQAEILGGITQLDMTCWFSFFKQLSSIVNRHPNIEQPLYPSLSSLTPVPFFSSRSVAMS